MSSLWLCCDPIPSKDLRKKEHKTDIPSSTFYGVFTEDPAVLGRMIPRPVTPFVPIDDDPFITKSADSDWYEPKICESPPTVANIDFNFDSKKDFEFTIF